VKYSYMQTRSPIILTSKVTAIIVRSRAAVSSLSWLLLFINFLVLAASQNHLRIHCSGLMSKHHPDLIMCRKQPGTTVGRLCEKCEGKCVMCDSLVRQTTLARICEECNYGSFQVCIRSVSNTLTSWRSSPSRWWWPRLFTRGSANRCEKMIRFLVDLDYSPVGQMRGLRWKGCG
jgi:PHF5-like protein